MFRLPIFLPNFEAPSDGFSADGQRIVLLHQMSGNLPISFPSERNGLLNTNIVSKYEHMAYDKK